MPGLRSTGTRSSMSESPLALTVGIGGRRWRVGSEQYDLSIPLAFDGAQPAFFGVAPAHGSVVRAGSFVGDVREGGSCNCATYVLTPHCNGTHTECLGHITQDRISVHEICASALHLALLVTVDPVPASATTESSDPRPDAGDMLVTKQALQDAAGRFAEAPFNALVVRTRPNDEAKRVRDYSLEPAAFFSAEAMHWIVAAGIEHLITDLPSLDRADDGGRLTAHRIFWNMRSGHTTPTSAARTHATVTELAYVPNEIPDGLYLLNLQVAPFVADAAPSRPILSPLTPL